MDDNEVTPSTPRTQQQLTWDERLEIQILHDIGWKYEAIAERLKVTSWQIQTALKYDHPTPQKQTGWPSMLSPEHVQILVDFVTASPENRQLPYHQIPTTLGWNCSENIIRYGLQKAGFWCYIARHKPYISETNRQKSLEWAHEHLNWTTEQWAEILWSDETWITGSFHWRVWVTRRPDEDLHPDCVLPKERKKRVGCFGDAFQANMERVLVYSGRKNGVQSMRRHTRNGLCLLLMDGYGFISSIFLFRIWC